MLNNFIKLKNCERLWAIGSVHGNLPSIKKVHDHIFQNYRPKDKIIYLGNMIGVGLESSETIYEILKFRSNLMSEFQLNLEDFVFLRGAQEEMLQKILELHISPNPKEVLLWTFEHGVDKTLMSYQINSKEILDVCELGSVSISKWTKKAKNHIDTFEGHKNYYACLVHAAFPITKKILFVNRGVDTSRPLSAQNDCFWWGYHNFSITNKPYYNFSKIVRGYDPKKTGPSRENVVCSLYCGSGFGGPVAAGLFLSTGEIIDIIKL